MNFISLDNIIPYHPPFPKCPSEPRHLHTGAEVPLPLPHTSNHSLRPVPCRQSSSSDPTVSDPTSVRGLATETRQDMNEFDRELAKFDQENIKDTTVINASNVSDERRAENWLEKPSTLTLVTQDGENSNRHDGGSHSASQPASVNPNQRPREAITPETTQSELLPMTQSRLESPSRTSSSIETILDPSPQRSSSEVGIAIVSNLQADLELSPIRTQHPAVAHKRIEDSITANAVSIVSAEGCSDPATGDTLPRNVGSPSPHQHSTDPSNILLSSRSSEDRSLSRDFSKSTALEAHTEKNRQRRSLPLEHSVSVVIPESPSFTPEVSEQPRTCQVRRSSKRKRVQPEQISDIDTDDPADKDYIEESLNSTEVGIKSHPPKRPRKKPVPNLTSRRAKCDARNVSPTAMTIPQDRDPPIARPPLAGFHDIQTIQIRGFLTREIRLSKVIWSFSFQEDNDSSFLAALAADSISKNVECCGKHEELPIPVLHPTSTSGQGTKGTEFSADEDGLLISLKENDGLSWSEIAKHFPRRTKGSLQVRYSTKLKTRRSGADVCSGRSSYSTCEPRGRPPRSRRP